MIKQIENAFKDNEISFPPENFVAQLKAYYNQQPKKMSKIIKANAGFFEGLIVRYHNGRDSISVQSN